MSTVPRFVCIGGTTRAGSSTERALRYTATLLEESGGVVDVFAGPDLILPMYSSEQSQRSVVATRIVEALRAADGLVLASPGYHGGFSGLIKNVLDYLEDMANDPAPYLKDRTVGCIASAFGWQATGTTLLALRSVVHALNAWPTPTGVSMISTGRLFDEAGRCVNEELDSQFRRLAAEMIEFAERRHVT